MNGNVLETGTTRSPDFVGTHVHLYCTSTKHPYPCNGISRNVFDQTILLTHITQLKLLSGVPVYQPHRRIRTGNFHAFPPPYLLRNFGCKFLRNGFSLVYFHREKHTPPTENCESAPEPTWLNLRETLISDPAQGNDRGYPCLPLSTSLNLEELPSINLHRAFKSMMTVLLGRG